MRITKNIIFKPISTSEIEVCHKLRIPFITSAVFGGFPIFIGDLDKEEEYMKIIAEESKKREEMMK